MVNFPKLLSNKRHKSRPLKRKQNRENTYIDSTVTQYLFFARNADTGIVSSSRGRFKFKITYTFAPKFPLSSCRRSNLDPYPLSLFLVQ